YAVVCMPLPGRCIRPELARQRGDWARGRPGGRTTKAKAGSRFCPCQGLAYRARSRTPISGRSPPATTGRPRPDTARAPCPSTGGSAWVELLQAVKHRAQPGDVPFRAEYLVEPGLVERLTLASRLLGERLAEWRPGLPGAHRRLLDQRIGILTRQSGLDEFEQHGRGVDQAAGRVQVGPH